MTQFQFWKKEISRNIKISFDQTIGRLDDCFFNLGYDEILSTAEPFAKASLRLLKDLVPDFKYIRIHNIFTGPQGDRKGKINAGCHPVTRDSEGNLVFNWKKIDEVYDVIVNLGYVPYIEFGFIPNVLSSAQNETNILGNPKPMERYPPKDYNEWRILISSLIGHFIDRYGEKEIKKRWCFELWNEPNSRTFWRGSKDEFFRLYDYTVAGMFDAIPDGNFKIGAPALSSTSYKFMRKFIEHCLWEENYVSGEIGTKLDFLSFHVKGGWGWQTPSMKSMVRLILSYQAVIDYYKKNENEKISEKTPSLLPEDIEIHITELDPLVGCDLGVEDNSKFQFRNDEYYSSFIGYTGMLMFWMKYKYGLNITEVFSDNIHFADEAGKIFKGTRNLTTASFNSSKRDDALKTTHAFAKPVVKAYQMLGLLHDEVIDIRFRSLKKHRVYFPVSILATKKDKNIRLLITHFQGKFDSDKSAEINLDFNFLDTIKKAEIDYFRVDNKHNNTFALWSKMGCPKKLDKHQMDEVKSLESNLVKTNSTIKEVDQQCFKISFSLKARDLLLIEINLIT